MVVSPPQLVPRRTFWCLRDPPKPRQVVGEFDLVVVEPRRGAVLRETSDKTVPLVVVLLPRACLAPLILEVRVQDALLCLGRTRGALVREEAADRWVDERAPQLVLPLQAHLLREERAHVRVWLREPEWQQLSCARRRHHAQLRTRSWARLAHAFLPLFAALPLHYVPAAPKEASTPKP